MTVFMTTREEMFQGGEGAPEEKTTYITQDLGGKKILMSTSKGTGGAFRGTICGRSQRGNAIEG